MGNESYMSYLDKICDFNYHIKQGFCTQHAYPLTHSQAKLQKIAMPSLFKSGKLVNGSGQRPSSLLRDPPTVLASKMSSAVDNTALPTIPNKIPTLGRSVIQPTLPQPDIRSLEETDILSDINESLPTLYPVRRQCNRHVHPP